MDNTIQLKDIRQHGDGIWSTQSLEQIDGFVASEFHSEFGQIEDFSFDNQSLNKLDQTFARELHFSPMRANYLRAFDWSQAKCVLEIGCGSGSLVQFLAGQDLQVDAIEPNRQLAQLAQLRTRKFTQVRIFSDAFGQLDFAAQKYDVIILNGVIDSVLNLSITNSKDYADCIRQLLQKCAALLNTNGQILLAADNRQGLKYVYGATDERVQKSYYGFNGYKQHHVKQSLNLSEWRSLINDLEFAKVQEYYLFPDYRLTSVILGKDYCQQNQFAFQHLEGISSKDYFQYQALGVNEILLYQAANGHGHLGDFANSCLFVLSKHQFDHQAKFDFVHLPSFKRRREFVSIVKKKSDEEFIRRDGLFDDSESVTAQTESYQQGCQLSVIWRNSIISDHRGIEFQQHLLRYLDYLKKLDSGVFDGFNVDAIPNNIIVDEDDNYQLIDREWIDYEQGIDAVYVFYRAVVHFALRNESIFYHFNWVKGISTLSDFIFYCFKSVGLNENFADLELLREKDTVFLSHVLIDSEGYELTDAFGSARVNRPIYPTISWSCESDGYMDDQSSVVKVSPDNKLQRLIYVIGRPKKAVKYFRFQPFLHLQALEAGYFDVKNLNVRAVTPQDDQSIILNLETSSDVYSANTNSAVFHADNESQSHFMFQTAHTFLEFEMPHYELKDDEQLQIELDFRLSPSLDYQIAREQYAFVERQMAEQLRIKDEKLQVLNKKYTKLKQELEEIEASRIWRLLEAYRDTFKISGYPQKNFFVRVGHLISRFKASKNRPEKDWSD